MVTFIAVTCYKIGEFFGSDVDISVIEINTNIIILKYLLNVKIKWIDSVIYRKRFSQTRQGQNTDSAVRRHVMDRLNSGKFRNLYFQAEIVIFWGKITKMITRVHSRILTNSPYIKWVVSSRWSSSLYYHARFERNDYREDTPHFMIFKIFQEKWQFQLENINFEISRNSDYPSHTRRTALSLSYPCLVFFVRIFRKIIFLDKDRTRTVLSADVRRIGGIPGDFQIYILKHF